MISNQVAAGAAPQPAGRDAPGPDIPRTLLPRGQSPVPAALLLAVIPLVLFGGPVAVSRPTAPVPVKPVRTENVRVIRMDAQTFRGRWMPIHDLAPATVIREVPTNGNGTALDRPRNYRIGDRPLRSSPTVIDAVPAAIEASSSKLPARIVRRASLRLDVCARHGLAKIEVIRGRWKGWRCRRR